MWGPWLKCQSNRVFWAKKSPELKSFSRWDRKLEFADRYCEFQIDRISTVSSKFPKKRSLVMKILILLLNSVPKFFQHGVFRPKF